MKSAIRPLRETRVKWLRLDCLNSNPDRIMRSPVAMLIDDDAFRCDPSLSSGLRTRRNGYLAMSQGVGMSGEPKPRFSTTSGKHEIAYGARALWRRSHRSSQRTGKPSTRWALVQRQNTMFLDVRSVQAPTSAGIGSPIPQGTAYLEGKAHQAALETNGLSPFTPTRRRVAGSPVAGSRRYA
jgi:hypothetical protein